MNTLKKQNRKIIILITILGVLSSSVGIFYVTHREEIKFVLNDTAQKKQLINDSTFQKKGFTVIYDKNDKVINKLISSNYIYEKYNNIPKNARDSFIAIEDKDFWKHGSISIKGSMRALYQVIRNKGQAVQGGSTLTQQLVKNVFLTNKKTVDRKIEEILLAIDIQHKYSKDKILEFYLNNIYFGRGQYGIQTASRGYFQKDIKDLTLSETAFLAAIPNNPSIYDPILHKDNTIKRRNLILKCMLNEGYIDKIQYTSALKEEIVLNPLKSNPSKDDYVTSYAIDNATKDLMSYDGFNFRYVFKDNSDKAQYQKIYSEKYSDYDKRIRSGGYSIYTSIDMDKQKQLQSSVDSKLESFTSRDSKTNKYTVQGAAVSIDNSTGYVSAIVGGRGEDDQFNRAFLAYRQPGSAIKPVLVYTPSFDNKYHPLSKIVDQYIPNGPQNDERSYFGSVTLRYATEMSLNTVPYILMTRLGADKLIPYLLNMHFSGIYKEDYNSIAAIGGFTKGASPVEMAGAYSTLAHSGTFTDTTCVRKMTYQDGSIIAKNQATLNREKVYNPESAYMMTDILKGVLTKSYATGHNLLLANGQISAGKTGTTENNKDGWFCGYTRYYTTVVWVGSDMPEQINNLYGAVYPGAIWKDYMDKIHSGLVPKDFEKPDTVIYKNINPDTGEIVSYDSGVQDMFSKPILDKIEQDRKKAEAEARAKQEFNYRKTEPEREKQVEKDLEVYESSSYTSVESLYTIDSLKDKIDNEIKQLIDIDKADIFRDKFDKRTNVLKSKRDQWLNIKKQQEEESERKIEENRSSTELINKQKELLEEQNRSKEIQDQQEQQNNEYEQSLEKEAFELVQKIQNFPQDTNKLDPEYKSAVDDASKKIELINNKSLAQILKQAIEDKSNLLK